MSAAGSSAQQRKRRKQFSDHERAERQHTERRRRQRGQAATRRCRRPSRVRRRRVEARRRREIGVPRELRRALVDGLGVPVMDLGGLDFHAAIVGCGTTAPQPAIQGLQPRRRAHREQLPGAVCDRSHPAMPDTNDVLSSTVGRMRADGRCQGLAGKSHLCAKLRASIGKIAGRPSAARITAGTRNDR